MNKIQKLNFLWVISRFEIFKTELIPPFWPRSDKSGIKKTPLKGVIFYKVFFFTAGFCRNGISREMSPATCLGVEGDVLP